MATVANLYINVGARMKPLINGMMRGSKAVKRFRKSAAASFKGIAVGIGGALRKVGKWIALVGGAAMAAAIVAFKKTATAIDKVAKVSRRLGVGVAELQGLHLAAKMSGIETATLDMALQRMTRRVAEAALGMGESQAALRELGLSAADMAKKSPDQMMMDIADALQKVPSQADKVRLAFKLFDSEGVSLVQMLGEGSSGLQAFQDKAKSLGLALSQDQAKGVEDFNDKLTELGTVIQGALQQAVVAIAPYLTSLLSLLTTSGGSAQKFGAFALAAFKMFAQVVAFAIDTAVPFVSTLAKVSAFMGELQLRVVQLAMAVLDFYNSVLKIVGLGGIIEGELLKPIEDMTKNSIVANRTIGIMFDSLGSAQLGVANLFNAVELDSIRAASAVDESTSTMTEGTLAMGMAMAKVADDAAEMTTKLEEQIATFGMSSRAAEVYALKQRGAETATLDTIKALHEQLDGLEKQKSLMAEGEKVFESVQTPLEAYEKQVGKLQELLEAGAIDQQTFTRAIAKAKEGLDKDDDASGGGGGITDSVQTALGSVTLPGMRAMETTAEKSLSVEKKSYERLGQILDATKKSSSTGALT